MSAKMTNSNGSHRNRTDLNGQSLEVLSEQEMDSRHAGIDPDILVDTLSYLPCRENRCTRREPP